MRKRIKVLVVFLWLAFAGTGAALSSLAGMFLYLSPKLEPVSKIRDLKLETPLRIYSADKQLIGEIGEHRRIPLNIKQIPEDLKNAIIATEDEDFYEHSGVSVKGIARAVFQIIKTGRKGSGGSTITQQITRHVFLHLRAEFTRKFKEIILARKLEQELSKDEILELYCNYMFLGKRAYGVEAAAQAYYGQSLSELNLAQLSMIAGIFKSPNGGNPINAPEKALKRRNYVLSRMLDEGFLDQQRYEEAKTQPITATQHGKSLDISAPYITEMARAKAVELYGQAAYREGYEIYTTVNSELQNVAQNAVVNSLLAYDKRHGYRGPELSLEALDISEPSSEPSLQAIDTPENPEPQEPIDYSPWIKQLRSIPVYANLMPAVVTQVSEDQLSFMFADANSVSLSWPDRLAKTRLYVNENVRNPAPKSALDFLSSGDVVRLIQDTEGEWQLSQLPKVQGAFVALNPENGAIISLVGGFDFYLSNFNRVNQAERQPGSNFKPFLYTTALEAGMTAATVINDAPIVFEYDEQLESDWRPKNDNQTFSGPTRLRKALYGSMNVVSIRLMRAIGVSTTIQNLGKFGFKKEKLPRDLSVSLGSLSTTPLDLVSAYAVFANGGYKVSPWLIERIDDIDGNTVYLKEPVTVCRKCEEQEEELASPQAEETREIELATPGHTESPSQEDAEVSDSPPPVSEEEFGEDPFLLSFFSKHWLGILSEEDYPKADKVLDDQVAYLIDSILKDVVKRGTGTRAKQLGRTDLAGKTGTTNGPKDVWFSGYNGDVVATAWVGFDQFEPLGSREYGGTAAMPIWMDFMEVALKGKPQTTRPQPPGIVTVKINPETGERAPVSDPKAIFEYFRSENVPELKETVNDPTMPGVDEETITEGIF